MAKTLARRCLLLPLLGSLGALGCTDPNVFLPSYQPGGPQGILGGTVTYSGPLPCTENGHVVGAAIFLAFNTDALPPPEGLGTTAASLAALPGDQLFGGVEDQLTFNPTNTKDPASSLWCPPSGTSVTVSGDWTIGPLPGGEYEVRGFYDLPGTFDPEFSISTLPVQGDIAGGAIDDVPGLLMQAAALEQMSLTPLIGTNLHPDYRRIDLGTQPTAGPCAMDSDCVTAFGAGNTCQGGFCMPPQGANIDGVAVTLGLPLPLGLPIFYQSQVLASANACVNGMVMGVTPPTTLTMPADYQLPTFSDADPMGTEQSILRVELSAGVPSTEQSAAAASPFNLPVAPPSPTPMFTYAFQDVNGDGVFNIGDDHTAASDIVPALFPLAIFNKLAEPNDDLTAQGSPAIILQGITIYQNLLSTVMLTTPQINDLPPQSTMIAGITPAVVCINPADTSPTASATLLVSHFNDCQGNQLITDMGGTITALKKQFGVSTVNVKQGCLPQGRYAMNLVYGSGQAWTVPNPAGVCAASETQSTDGTTCSAVTTQGPTTRARLASQDNVLTIGAPSDPSYCLAMATQTPPECCPAPTDGTMPIDPSTGTCKCPNADPTNPKFACP